ncbi:isopeptide-forming domain-containing fimbrial protein [Streptococcus parauberis]|nr:isopeptide-forming domain-containing fimbrial protein [Streptococcus parauberis]
MKQLDKQTLKTWFVRLLVASVAVSGVAYLGLASGLFIKAQELGTIITGTNTVTKATQEGCSIKIETTEKVDWKMPRQPIDLVILQDNSGSFENTIGNVQNALKSLTTPLGKGEVYDVNNPKLVFTGDPTTTDRVMVNTFRGIDAEIQYRRFKFDSNATLKYIDFPMRVHGYFTYDASNRKIFVKDESTYYSNGYYYYNYSEKDLEGSYAKGILSKDDFSNKTTVESTSGTFYDYHYTSSPLMTSSAQINDSINSMVTGGGTPTVPAIDDTIAAYNKIKGTMANNRRTVFLLVTDGVANGYRKTGDSTVYFDRSMDRNDLLLDEWRPTDANGYSIWPEAAQDYISRANELSAKGAQLKQTLGPDSTVVVGFWEDTKAFTGKGQYGPAYLNPLDSPKSETTMQTGDPRSIQDVFHESIQSVASPDKVLPNGETASFYVNESDINLFSEKILKAVASALVQEDVKGDFTITDGYSVDSITINGKTVVPNVTDPTTQIHGTVNQDGNKVTIYVPESVFKPGDNAFDYKLKRTEESPNMSEADETPPSEGYKPATVEREVGQLVGKFSVGDYTSPQIGSTTPTKVQVTDLKYCYPRATKDVKDRDITNDKHGDDGKSGNLAQDPLLASSGIVRPSYAATLTDQSEKFTYSVNYNMYNVPLEMKQNVMFTDQLNYHLDYLGAYVTDDAGNKLTDFVTSTQATKDLKGNPTTTVVVTVPKLPGTNNDTVKEGEYGGHAFKNYKLVIDAKIKDQYSLQNNATEYYKMMQENNGLGFMNQAAIIWNGDTTSISDSTARIRRSNAVYVAPPLSTDVTKEVGENSNEVGTNHLELPVRSDDYYYRVNSTWPGIFDSYTVEDILVPELESLNSEGLDKVYVNGIEIPSLTKFIKVEQVSLNGQQRDRVYLDLQKSSLTRLDLYRINKEITAANDGNNGPAKLTLAVKAKIRDDASLDKYLNTKTGKVLVPNTANVTLDSKKLTSNEVTVTPNTPTAIKLINEELQHLNTSKGQEFTYDVMATLPSDINSANEYVIKDVIDNRIELVNISGTNSPIQLDEHTTDLFDTEIVTENGKQVIYVRMKSGAFAHAHSGDVVHIKIGAKVKDSSTGTINNVADITYNGKPTTSTPPVTVTPPPPVTKTVEPTVTERQAGAADGVPEGTYTAKINKSGEDIELAVWNDPYLYKVSSVVPSGAKTFTITDTLIPEMEMYDNITGSTPRKVEVNVNGTMVEIPTNQIVIDKSDLDKQTISVTLTEEQIKEYVDKPITLSFTAKFKQYASLTKYISDTNGLPKAPNKASVIVNDNPKIDSNTVTVTPPINKPEIKKTVNDTEHFDLDSIGQIFRYTIKTEMPYNANSFEITDIFEPAIDFKSLFEEVLVQVGDKRYTGEELTRVLKVEEKVVNGVTTNVGTVSFSAKDIQGNEAKPVIIEFLSRIKKDSDLSKYRFVKDNHSVKYADNSEHAEIPNDASYIINNKITNKSNVVTVTPPPPTASELDKKIEDPYSKNDPKDLVDDLSVENGKDYNYFLDTVMPSNIYEYQSWKLEDTMDPRLELSSTEKPYIQAILEDGTVDPSQNDFLANHFEISTITATVDGKATKQVVVKVKDGSITEIPGSYKIRLVIPAHIKVGVTDVKIPNKAVKTGVKHNGDIHILTSPTVTVTPPQDDPTLDKKIVSKAFDGKETQVTHLDVDNLVPYEYDISSKLPTDILKYKKFVITDTLDSKLSVINTDATKPYILGAAAEFFDITVDGQTVTATLKDYKVAEAADSEAGGDSEQFRARFEEALVGKTINLRIPAQINKDVTTQLIENIAKLDFTNAVNEDKDIETPPVTVSPPGETPNVTKTINDGLDHLDVDNEKDYTYNIKSTLPVDITKYKSFVIVDELAKDLAIQGTPVVTGDAAKFFDVKVDGQKVTATMKDFANAKDLAGKEIELVITSQIRAGVTRQAIPNTTKVTYENKSNVSGTPAETPSTPPVTVTPPGETPNVTKTINDGLDHLDVDNEKDYTYNIKSTLPVDITKYKSFVIVDELAKDLAIQGTPVVTGDAAKFFDVKVDGQKVTATMKDFANAKDLAGKEIELVITSQIRGEVERQNIPNTAKIVYQDKSHVNGQPDTEIETPPVTVTPPTPDTPDLTKKVNKLEHADLANRQESFTFTIDTTLPKNAFAFEVTDTLENVLSFDGDIKATVDGKNVPTEQIVTDGQTLTVKFTKEQLKSYAGQAVHIEFIAKVKDGADLTPYLTTKGISVPNTAKYIINNNPDMTKDSNPVTVTPPTPEEPVIEKYINRTEKHLDIDRGKSYMYNVNVSVPNDIATYKQFVISDTLDAALTISGPVEVHVDGYKLADSTFKVVPNGNHVTVTVNDFAALAGYKQIQLYIPSMIKEGIELDKATYPDNKIPNIATVDFINSNGKEGSKETKPVTVTPPTPETPEVPEEPTPETPVKSVGHDDTDQSKELKLKLADEKFRFDVKAVVPTDKDEKNRIDLTHFNMSDTLDPNLMVARVAVEITTTKTTIPEANFNYIDEDLEKATQELKDAQAKLDEISKAATSTDTQKSVEDAQAKVTDLEDKLAEAEAKLAELKTTEPVPTDGTTPDSSVDNTAAITAQEAIIADLKGQLATAKTDLSAAQKVLSEAKTPAEIKVELDNQQKLVDKAQEAFDKADAKAKEVAEKADLLAKLINQGELTEAEMTELGISTAKSKGQLVNVEITDKATLEALKGYTVKTIIYSSIKPGTDLTPYLKDGFENIATVSFNHGPSSTWTKDTNPVHVFPPTPETPDKPVTPPPGKTPPRRTPPARPSRPILPRTGDASATLAMVIGTVIAGLGLVGLKKRGN